MRIILNPKYEHLREYLTHLEEHFEKDGKEIHRDRNVLRVLRIEGLTICVKRYAPPSLTGSLAQKLYKTPKGKKAYFNPLHLRERGIESPEPIAFVKYNKGLLRTTTYFVCLYSHYRFNMSDVMTLDPEERDCLIKHFGRFAARLHQKGFLHRDFTSSNILYDIIDGKYRFTLIDTNSLKSGRPLSIEKGCQNLGRLTGDDDFIEKLATAYAEVRGFDRKKCLELINKARR